MRSISLTITLALLTSGSALAQANRDVAGGRDHPLVGRYEGSALRMVSQKDFEELRIITRRLTDADQRQGTNYRTESNSIPVAGRAVRMRYEGPTGPSALEVSRNFEQKLTSSGAEILFTCRARQCDDSIGSSMYYANSESPLNPRDGSGSPGNWDTQVYLAAKIPRPGGDVYVTIYTTERREGSAITPVSLVDVVETQAMATGKITVVDAAKMASEISAKGRVTLYGILFDFDRAEIRSESKAAIDQIASFLRSNPAVSLVVAGHTDAKGGFDYNIALSQKRAAAVVAALVRDYGIDAQRLTPFGAGMAAPVAPNDEEAGRALNRRVELVRR